MPRIDHLNIGEVVDTHYYQGKILEIKSGNDVGLCKVEITVPEISNITADNIPIYFHCDDTKAERENGSLEDGETAFDVDDLVIVQVIGDVRFL